MNGPGRSTLRTMHLTQCMSCADTDDRHVSFFVGLQVHSSCAGPRSKGRHRDTRTRKGRSGTDSESQVVEWSEHFGSRSNFGLPAERGFWAVEWVLAAEGYASSAAERRMALRTGPECCAVCVEEYCWPTCKGFQVTLLPSPKTHNPSDGFWLRSMRFGQRLAAARACIPEAHTRGSVFAKGNRASAPTPTSSAPGLRCRSALRVL
jgi:hypothetical protein